MSLEDLKHAVFESKFQDTEETAIDVIAKVLEVPAAAVERVLYAASLLRKPQRYTQIIESMDDGPSLPKELRDAIKMAVERGMRRAIVRFAIQNDAKLSVKPRALIGEDSARICDGCPLSMRCVIENLSTPKACAKKGPPSDVHISADKKVMLMRYSHGQAMVTPERIRGDKVVVHCQHPMGTWEIDIMDVLP